MFLFGYIYILDIDLSLYKHRTKIHYIFSYNITKNMQTLSPICKILQGLYSAYSAYICTAQIADDHGILPVTPPSHAATRQGLSGHGQPATLVQSPTASE